MFHELFWQDVFQQRPLRPGSASDARFRPGEGIIEVVELAPHGRTVYAFEMAARGRLHFDASADGPVVIGLATFDEYERWIESVEPSDELKVLQLKVGQGSAKIRFRAETKDEYAVVVVSLSEAPIQLIIGAQYN